LIGREPPAFITADASVIWALAGTTLLWTELPTYLASGGIPGAALGPAGIPPPCWSDPLLKEVGVPAPVGDIIPPPLEAGIPPIVPIPWLAPQGLFVIPVVPFAMPAVLNWALLTVPGDMPDMEGIESAPPAVLPTTAFWDGRLSALFVQPALASARPPAKFCCRGCGLLQQLHPVMRMPIPHNPTQPTKGFLPIGITSPL
jgi:hypothetical protein